MKRYILYLLLVLPAILWSRSNNQIIKGFVYEDKNANGKLDDGEKRLNNVFVSNGVDITKTNRKGAYQLETSGGDNVFVILPSGYESSKPNLWYKKTKQLNENVNFGLKKIKRSKAFSIMAIGDVQVGTQDEIKFTGKTLGNKLVNSKDYAFGIFLGDMVNDTVGLFKPLKELLDYSKFPYKVVYGNHDRNFQNSKNNQQKDFENTFGPTTYAFFHQDVLFVTLNSIRPKGKYGYEGFYEDEEIEFVKHILSLVKKEQLIVINQHIPLAWIKNKEALLEHLNIENDILVLSGHTHRVSRRFYKRKGFSDIHELTSGAVSGNWWTGQKDWTGVPLALMRDGSPRGYFDINFEANDYQLAFKPLDISEEEQLSLWFGNLEHDGLPYTITKDHNQLILNYFPGSQKTEINAFINGEFYKTLKKERLVDPYVARIKKWQNRDLSPDKLSDPAPYLNGPSNHIWTLDLPWDKLKPTNIIKLEIKDPYLKTLTREFIFWKK
ncbi:calcineurin-like phosphoesterase C-terminal domain-containing protein [uncultured Salegentibacter sp.]|uniref:calcineurin-like phosphoesterase C-terminal domain-containing protein n=1 Tax=uncultured Salegentibacter sp. TaxID=259320 RepID=UPI0030D7440F